MRLRTLTNKFNIALLFLSTLVASCGRNVIYTDSSEMDNNVWNLSNTVVFEYDNADTEQKTDVDFLIRTTPSYPYRNIYLFVSSFSPEGKSITDTLEYILADEKGNWYGKGTGNIRSLSLPFRQNVFFSEMGTYTFRVSHGMRDVDLKGVADISIRVSKSDK